MRKFFYWHLCEKWVIENAAAVQLLSAAHEEPLRELGCVNEVFTIPNGCDPGELRHLDALARVPGKGRDFVVQYLGRMDRNHKGLDLLLKGYALFLNQLPKDTKVLLRLSGNDWVDRPFLENLARKLGIAERVQFTGRLSDHSLKIHGQADLSVLCSRFDGFGLTLMEALLAARPVVVSRQAGIAEFVVAAEAGFVVDPLAESIADGLRAAWDAREELARMGLRGQKYVCEQMTWEMIADRSVVEYQRVFGKARREKAALSCKI